MRTVILQTSENLREIALYESWYAAIWTEFIMSIAFIAAGLAGLIFLPYTIIQSIFYPRCYGTYIERIKDKACCYDSSIQEKENEQSNSRSL